MPAFMFLRIYEDNVIKTLFYSRLLDMRLVIANSYPTSAHHDGIIVLNTHLSHKRGQDSEYRTPLPSSCTQT